MQISHSTAPVVAENPLPSAERLLFPALGSFYSRAEPVLYAILRAVFGIIMFTHGLPKALGISHGSMADPMAGSINLIQNVMGLPFAPQLGFLVMLLETVGAVMLAIGLWARPVALAITVQMAGICYALGPTWPWIDRGIEFPMLMLFLALYIAVRGSGSFAVDRKLKVSI
ncbi:DoxX family protein [Bordetella genomosp. 4]|uniref:DoxX family protein n=1 Tax=Bordetella genomosp. 4 TaxID=463044 RepID=UPI000B9DF417|nr:DoxX family protein [Bordetella genomosp. 4]OZI43280.1 DoxX family protein [Bordetella genomosp. 4]